MIRIIRSCYLYIFIILSANPVFCVPIEEIITESDWEYLYRNGIYDYDTYLILRDIDEGGIKPDSLEFLLASKGISESLASIIRPYLGKNIKIHSAVSNTEKSDYYFKSGYKIGSSSISGYYLAKGHKSNYDYSVKFRDINSSTCFDNRFAKASFGDFDVTLGNYTLNFGTGLGIGKFDYKPLSFEEGGNLEQSLLFPDNSYYNGIKINDDGGNVIAYSGKKYNNVEKSLFAAGFCLKHDYFVVGLTGVLNAIKYYDKNKRILSSSMFVKFSDYFLSEIAVSDSKYGFNILLENKNTVFKGWSYSNSFLHLNCSGYSYPDYKTYNLDEVDLSFRQPQSGETGALIKRVLFSNSKFTGSVLSEFWENDQMESIKRNTICEAKLMINDVSEFYCVLKNSTRQSSVKYRMDIGYTIKSNIFMDIRIRNETIDWMHDNINSGVRLFSRIAIKARNTIGVKVYYDHKNYFDYFIEETINQVDFSYKITYKGSSRDRNRIGNLYLLCELRM